METTSKFALALYAYSSSRYISIHEEQPSSFSGHVVNFRSHQLRLRVYPRGPAFTAVGCTEVICSVMLHKWRREEPVLNVTVILTKRLGQLDTLTIWLDISCKSAEELMLPVTLITKECWGILCWLWKLNVGKTLAARSTHIILAHTDFHRMCQNFATYGGSPRAFKNVYSNEFALLPSKSELGEPTEWREMKRAQPLNMLIVLAGNNPSSRNLLTKLWTRYFTFYLLEEWKWKVAKRDICFINTVQRMREETQFKQHIPRANYILSWSHNAHN